jgi:tetratricopeptide (TPR) repeat protein
MTASRARARAELAIAALAPLLDDPDVGAEAWLRTGYLRFRAGDTALALEAFERAAAAHDPFVRYLSHFLTGRAHDRQGGRAPAEAAYRRALTALPGAQSAAIALSTLVFLDERPDEAYAIVDEAGRVSPQPADPWRVYGYGEFRRWPKLRADLRAHLTATSEPRPSREGLR